VVFSVLCCGRRFSWKLRCLKPGEGRKRSCSRLLAAYHGVRYGEAFVSFHYSINKPSIQQDIEDEIEQCRMGAARRVGEWLTVPQDLEKLPQLRATVASKKMATDAQLKAAVTGQLDSAREGMSLLSRSYNSILTVRNKYAFSQSPNGTKCVTVSRVSTNCAQIVKT